MTTILRMRKREEIHNPEGNVGTKRSVEMSLSVGQRIQRLCKFEGISVNELEDAAGLSRGTLSSVVSGRRAGRLSLYLVQLVADTLGTELGLVANGRLKHDESLQGFSALDALFLADLPPPLPPLAPRLVTPRLVPREPKKKKLRKRAQRRR
jgi:transcriptional regulator with XRE-family HTH domain